MTTANEAPPALFPVNPLLTDKDLTEIYNMAKPIAERSSYQDTKQLARIICRLVECWRGSEVKTELPPRHHA